MIERFQDVPRYEEVELSQTGTLTGVILIITLILFSPVFLGIAIISSVDNIGHFIKYKICKSFKKIEIESWRG